MALRLPEAARSIRRTGDGRRIATIGFAAIVLTILPMRILLAAVEIATWTSAWQTIDTVSRPFVFPFEAIEPLGRALVGFATLADLFALAIWGGVAVYLLALLTVRRRR